MSILDKIKKGTDDRPNRILLYGVEKIGKSTWAADAPAPVFVCSEDGLGPDLNHVQRIAVDGFAEVLAVVDELTRGDHDFRTVVIDTADWLEALIHRYICDRDGKDDIEAYGYGKGYVAAQGELRKLLAALDTMRLALNIEVIFLAHATIKAFANPAGDNWDRYIMKGHDKFTGLIKEWSDVVLFARHEVYIKKDSKTAAKGKPIGDARVVHTNWDAAWDAGNRLSLPETLPLNYDAYASAARRISAGDTDQTRELAAEITGLFASAEWPKPELAAKVAARLGGTITAEALAKLPATKLQPAADYLRTLQPEPKEDVA